MGLLCESIGVDIAELEINFYVERFSRRLPLGNGNG
jgi:hypothetical protein